MNYSNVDKFSEYLKTKEIGGPDTPQLESTTEDIDENSGIAFPGNSIRLHYKQTFKEGENLSFGVNSNLDLFVVEQATHQGNYMFKWEKNPGFMGKCEFCYNYKVLKVVCACKKVAYCDEDHRRRDEYYHLKDCDAEN